MQDRRTSDDPPYILTTIPTSAPFTGALLLPWAAVEPSGAKEEARQHWDTCEKVGNERAEPTPKDTCGAMGGDSHQKAKQSNIRGRTEYILNFQKDLCLNYWRKGSCDEKCKKVHTKRSTLQKLRRSLLCTSTSKSGKICQSPTGLCDDAAHRLPGGDTDLSPPSTFTRCPHRLLIRVRDPYNPGQEEAVHSALLFETLATARHAQSNQQTGSRELCLDPLCSLWTCCSNHHLHPIFFVTNDDFPSGTAFYRMCEEYMQRTKWLRLKVDRLRRKFQDKKIGIFTFPNYIKFSPVVRKQEKDPEVVHRSLLPGDMQRPRKKKYSCMDCEDQTQCKMWHPDEEANCKPGDPDCPFAVRCCCTVRRHWGTVWPQRWEEWKAKDDGKVASFFKKLCDEKHCTELPAAPYAEMAKVDFEAMQEVVSKYLEIRMKGDDVAALEEAEKQAYLLGRKPSADDLSRIQEMLQAPPAQPLRDELKVARREMECPLTKSDLDTRNIAERLLSGECEVRLVSGPNPEVIRKCEVKLQLEDNRAAVILQKQEGVLLPKDDDDDDSDDIEPVVEAILRESPPKCPTMTEFITWLDMRGGSYPNLSKHLVVSNAVRELASTSGTPFASLKPPKAGGTPNAFVSAFFPHSPHQHHQHHFYHEMLSLLGYVRPEEHPRDVMDDCEVVRNVRLRVTCPAAAEATLKARHGQDNTLLWKHTVTSALYISVMIGGVAHHAKISKEMVLLPPPFPEVTVTLADTDLSRKVSLKSRPFIQHIVRGVRDLVSPS